MHNKKMEATTMKKYIVLILSVIMILSLAACGGSKENASNNPEPTAVKHKIALISDTIGTEQFILQAYNEMKALASEYGFEWSSIECADTAQWKENAEAASNEGYDMIIGIGWQAADPFAAQADLHPEIKYVVIDTTSSNEKVTSIGFKEWEGAYVLGAMIATAFPEESQFGYISSFQTQATFKYRYGYSEGVLSVNPDAKFMYNFINSYQDTTLAYEYALQQQSAGCKVIMGGASASSNSGIYQAALELAAQGKTIYTTGLSVDQTTEENPYILGGLLKNTGACTRTVVEEFLKGELKGGPQLLGLKENAFGVVYVTTETANYRNEDIITDAVVEAGKAVAQKIISGELVIEVPEESAN